jgi:hypothetical protein
VVKINLTIDFFTTTPIVPSQATPPTFLKIPCRTFDIGFGGIAL